MNSSVGPILTSGKISESIVQAIKNLNDNVEVEEHGSYIRVLVPHHCFVTATEIEAQLGRSFALPGDLEIVMLSFMGKLTLNKEYAEWKFKEEEN